MGYKPLFDKPSARDNKLLAAWIGEKINYIGEMLTYF